MGRSQLDLSRLALDRSPSQTSQTNARRHRWISRYLVPASILLGFLALLGVAAGRQLLPKPSVTVVPVIVKRGDVQQTGTPLFQAPGWIEPRPTSVSVAALAPGVVDELLVVEGQQVTKGEPIARLIAIDVELDAQRAQLSLELREGELQRAQAELRAAITRLENPVHLQAQLADAESRLAKVTTEMKKLPFQIASASANVEFTQSSLNGKRAAKNAIAGIVIKEAAKEHAAARFEFEELQQRGPHLRQEIRALQKKVDALQVQLELLVEERRQADEAKAKVVSTTALRDDAKLQLRQAELMLERTVIRSPMDGRVLRLVSLPGSRVMGLQHTAGLSSSTVVEMYDPNRLQVRADVRLEDIPRVSRGALVEVETPSSGSPIKGRVLQTTSSANIQKNTLEVKVELIDPPQTVSPEMLVTATFLAPALETKSDQTTLTERLFAPQQLIQSDGDESTVWVVGASGRANRKTVQTGGMGSDGLFEITAGLNATDKLITSSVQDLDSGDAVTIAGEDQILGIGR